jgi:hypothetical protein
VKPEISVMRALLHIKLCCITSIGFMVSTLVISTSQMIAKVGLGYK